MRSEGIYQGCSEKAFRIGKHGHIGTSSDRCFAPSSRCFLLRGRSLHRSIGCSRGTFEDGFPLELGKPKIP